MDKKYCLVIVEGPDDQAVVGKLLRSIGLKKFSGAFSELDPFWQPLVPKYPKKGDLYNL